MWPLLQQELFRSRDARAFSIAPAIYSRCRIVRAKRPNDFQFATSFPEKKKSAIIVNSARETRRRSSVSPASSTASKRSTDIHSKGRDIHSKIFTPGLDFFSLEELLYLRSILYLFEISYWKPPSQKKKKNYWMDDTYSELIFTLLCLLDTIVLDVKKSSWHKSDVYT